MLQECQDCGAASGSTGTDKRIPENTPSTEQRPYGNILGKGSDQNGGSTGTQKRRTAPEELVQTGNAGWKLVDVLDEKVDLDTFTAQLSDEDLIEIFRGEGMCSPKVTAGTAAAFGGLTESLRNYGIPAACCADGPSGIRMDCGTRAFSLPNGTALGCTFDQELVEELYTMTGQEIRLNKIDSLLGPGMNIHRPPIEWKKL